MDRNVRENLAIMLADYILANQKPEYGVFRLMEDCKLDEQQVSVAVIELSELGLITAHKDYLVHNASFSSISLKNNALKNIETYIKHSRRSGLQKQLITLNVPSSPNSEGSGIMKSIYTIVGSPYGFTESDWDAVIQRKKDTNTIDVVLGYQFESKNYSSAELITNLRLSLTKAVDYYNEVYSENKIHLRFRDLQSGIGEHLFNEIARDILSSDVAIFETSDLNPNVMIELGIALTSGTSVVPIRQEDSPNPPSDISGQVWIKYRDSAKTFASSNDDGAKMFKDLFVRVMKEKIRKANQVI
jgi:hypothetical protein